MRKFSLAALMLFAAIGLSSLVTAQDPGGPLDPPLPPIDPIDLPPDHVTPKGGPEIIAVHSMYRLA
jgi:hypothetical protein